MKGWGIEEINGLWWGWSSEGLGGKELSSGDGDLEGELEVVCDGIPMRKDEIDLFCFLFFVFFFFYY